MSSSTIPYWAEKKNVINADSLFFHLNDDYKQKVCIVYHGMYITLKIAHLKEQLPVFPSESTALLCLLPTTQITTTSTTE